jgi:hypothetical protein
MEEESNAQLAAVDLFFLQKDGKCFKVKKKCALPAASATRRTAGRPRLDARRASPHC